MTMNVRKILGAVTAAALAVTAMVIPASAEDAVESYKFGLIFQAPDWLYRDSLDQEYLNNDEKYSTEFKDVTIFCDGTYTVEVNGLPSLAKDDPWHKLHIETTMAKSDLLNCQIELISIVGGTFTERAPRIGSAIGLINEWNDLNGDPAVIIDEDVTDIKITFSITGTGLVAPVVTTEEETPVNTSADETPVITSADETPATSSEDETPATSSEESTSSDETDPAETTTGVNGSTTDPGNDKNQPTGIVFALVPAISAAAAAIVFKKRK